MEHEYTHHNGHNHGHDHGDGHGHKHGHHHDPGAFYEMAWVQEQLKTIDAWLKENSNWIGIDAGKPQRVLDYACGNGTVSKALLDSSNPSTTFHGLDSSFSQIDRFNAEADRLSASDRMKAVVGDLATTSDDTQADHDQKQQEFPAQDDPEWNDFDLAISSMALHHFGDPVAMLRALASRLRQTPSGLKEAAVVILDHCSLSIFQQAENPSKKEVQHSEKDASLDSSTLRAVTHGEATEKVWAGFTPGELQALMRAAGLKRVGAKVHPGVQRVPRATGDGTVTIDGEEKGESEMEWEESKFVLAKGYVG